MTHKIIHLDMDAFYASVEILDNPQLAGLPVIVGGSSNRGVVSAASYEARTYGVHSALAIAVARNLCPQGIFLPVRMSRYLEVSERIMDIFSDYTPRMEQISVDEAFLDVTGCESLFGSAEHIAAIIRQRVREEIGLTVSAGVASSKLVAKIASDYQKPDGLTIVAPGTEADFLAPLPIKRLWGVGKKTIPVLALLGVKTIGDLTRFSRDFLEKKFGKHGLHMYYCSRGIDQREVETSQSAKSIGNEETFDSDITDPHRIKKELLRLATKVGERLRRASLSSHTITLKVRYDDFTTISRAITLPRPTNDSRRIYQAAVGLLSKTRVGARPVRLVGLAAGKLQEDSLPRQLDLFGGKITADRQELNKAIDLINKRFGSQTIKPAVLAGEPAED
ncbi:MAG: DNA polymerase IV [Deltaproteobacteria bacterium]|nr:DNA polymerase IV [Deltaproteobacteria bacterium]